MQHPNPALETMSYPGPASTSVPARGFKISAVVIGFVVDVLSSFVLLSLGGGAVGFYLASIGTAPSELAEAVMAAMATPAWLSATLVMGLLGTAMGGFVAARMARHAPRKHALALGIAALLLGALTEASSSSAVAQTPLWYDSLAYLLTIPAAVAGGAAVRPEE